MKQAGSKRATRTATATARNKPRSTDRKREILAAALQCFSAKGYAATTLADIRTRAGASTGSIYHHFTNKAEIAAELYLEGVRDTQEHGLRALLAQRSVEAGIKALVVAYLDWVQARPKFARFLFAMRHADFMEPVEGRLLQMNRDTLETASAWFRVKVDRGELPDLAPDVLRAILYGPAAHFARRLLNGNGNGEADAEIDQAKQQLAAAAYAGLRGLLPARSRRAG
jgi:AcrR family transcriptional regulator